MTHQHTTSEHTAKAPDPDAPIGLLPMAGRAARLGPLPCSKEILPLDGAGGTAPGALACHPTLEALARAGIPRAVIATTAEKADIEARLGDGRALGLDLEHLRVPPTRSMPETLARALEQLGPVDVALGFGDVVFAPQEAYALLLERRKAAPESIVLGLFPAPDPGSTEMVDLAPDGRVRGFEIRPTSSQLRFNWLLALWPAGFSDFLVAQVRAHTAAPDSSRELGLGEVFRAALAAGFPILGVPFPAGWYVDLGTPEGWRRLRERR